MHSAKFFSVAKKRNPYYRQLSYMLHPCYKKTGVTIKNHGNTVLFCPAYVTSVSETRSDHGPCMFRLHSVHVTYCAPTERLFV